MDCVIPHDTVVTWAPERKYAVRMQRSDMPGSLMSEDSDTRMRMQLTVVFRGWRV